MSLFQTSCTSFKAELLRGVHNFDVAGHTFMLALYTGDAVLDANTTAYFSEHEVVGPGYTAGGMPLVNLGVASTPPMPMGGVGFTSFDLAIWPVSTFTARAALIYNATPNDGTLINPAVCVLDFGSDKTVLLQDFVVKFPEMKASTAIIRAD